MIYGYARVSTTEQHLDRQLISLEKAGVPSRNIYCDKMSGKDFDRKNYLTLRKKLKEGDLLVIPSIDRLGRNYDMIIEEWTHITKKIGADIRVLDMPLLDTSANRESLTGKLISDIVLQLLSYVAQKERENLRERQREGIAAAKARGVIFGRPRLNESKDDEILYMQFIDGTVRADEASKILGLSTTTFYRRVNRFLANLAKSFTDEDK